MELKKGLTFLDVFSIASGAMISSGIFILPGLAFSYVGPAVFVSYILAGAFALCGILSVAELSTAMPKAGGDYYYITRTLGPFIGTISGVLSWVALSLKSAFAIFGIAEVIYRLTGLNVRLSSLIICVAFVLLNILGVKEAARFEVVLVVCLLSLMGGFFVLGVSHVTVSSFEPFVSTSVHAIFQTAGFVFVSFGGLLKVASVAEEVKQPKRNLPLGLIAAVSVVTLLYALLVMVTVGVLPAEQLRGSLTPIADAARVFTGTSGYVVMTVAALLAFITTVNAGIMSASRYPLALSRDNLLPEAISTIHRRFHTPVISICITGIFIMLALFLRLEVLVKVASTVVLVSYVLSNIAVIILRESRIQNYQPSFKAPLYPWLQILGIFLFSSLIADMGFATVEVSLSLIVIGICLYFFYGRKRSQHEYALLHVIERIMNTQLTFHNLEAELRAVLHQRDEVVHDHFDRIVQTAPVIDILGSVTREELFTYMTEHLARETPLEKDEILHLLRQREAESSTVITPFVAIPHIIVEGQDLFKLFIARCKNGIQLSEEHLDVKAAFVILGTKDKRNLHLKALAAIAQIIQEENFERDWMLAKDEHQLRDILLLSQRKRLHASTT